MAWFPAMLEDKRRCPAVEEALGGAEAEKPGILQERRGKLSLASRAAYDADHCDRSTPPVSSCHSRTSLTQLRLIPSQEASAIACKSLRRKRVTDSARRVKMHWRSGWAL